jgi:hypothetical protein
LPLAAVGNSGSVSLRIIRQTARIPDATGREPATIYPNPLICKNHRENENMVRAAVLLIVLVALSCAGCGQEGPTRAEALQLYTTEMNELQRLQTERSRLEQASHEEQLVGNIMGGLLGADAGVSKEDLDALAAGKMDKAIDHAAAEAEYSKWYSERKTNGEVLSDPAAETEAIKAKRTQLKLPIQPGIAKEVKAAEATEAKTKTHNEALAKLDAQIATQQARVDRARAVMDAIDARDH